MDAALTKAGIKHKFVRYKDRGHMRLTEDVINEMLSFIDDVEGSKPAATSAGRGR